MQNYQDIINILKLEPLPAEGGYYRESYRSEQQINVQLKGNANNADRSVSTAIYYMVTPDSFSALHRIKEDEVYHYYSGEPADMLLINPNGEHKIITLGNNIITGECVQYVVPAGTWQGVKLKSGYQGYALMGTTAAPGFDFADFELGPREELIKEFPELTELIKTFTR